MKAVTWNVNGLKSCMDKGLMEFIRTSKADFYCFQEIQGRCQLDTPGYEQYWNLAERKGYSGTLTLAKEKALRVQMELPGNGLNHEGRLIALEYEDFWIINVYVPNSQSSLGRAAYREAWDAALYDFLTSLEKPIILCGDFNVARTYIDVYPENLRNEEDPPGFIASERDSMEHLLAAGFVDVFRFRYPEQEGAYTWWSNRLHKRKENRGWRLDYFLISNQMAPAATRIEHLTDIYGSDHCPVCLELSSAWKAQRPRFTDEELAEMWDSLDWAALEEKLLRLQQSLTRAVFTKNNEMRVIFQKKIVRSLAAKALAVRHVVNIDSSPGIDGVRWETSAEKMRAARSLTSRGYHHQPYLRVEVTDGKRTRYANVPTAYDKAMQVLYAYSLDPVAEATGDRKSFAFRKGRSMFDCHAYLCKALSGADAPRWVFRGDVKACYDSISQRWLIQNIPMDTRVLRELLKAGAVFNGTLYPTDRGISLGASLSPILGNMVLDGMQDEIYKGLYGSEEPDYSNGDLIRYADDFIVTARTYMDAVQIRAITERFLAERGLILSDTKSFIVKIDDGFTFLSRSYRLEEGRLRVAPAPQAVAEFEQSLQEFILPYHGSQKNLILKLNRKLTGWANYHRVTDAHSAFRRIDAVVQSLLVRHARERHPRRQWGHIQNKYWYKDSEGDYVYSLPENRAVQVIKLYRAVITEHLPIKTNFNPYIDQEYYKSMVRRREIQKVSGGKLRGIWNRQSGRCYFCGNPMLPDHEICLTPVKFGLDAKSTEYAYIHLRCSDGMIEGQSERRPVPADIPALLENVREEKTGSEDPYYQLREFFRKAVKSPITLTFRDIEEMLGDALDWEAYFFPAFWFDEAPGFSGDLWQEQFPYYAVRPGQREHCISEAWLSQGYIIQRLHLESKRVVFRKNVHAASGLKVPKVLTDSKLPQNAIYELEEFFKYVIKKYNL